MSFFPKAVLVVVAQLVVDCTIAVDGCEIESTEFAEQENQQVQIGKIVVDEVPTRG